MLQTIYSISLILVTPNFNVDKGGIYLYMTRTSMTRMTGGDAKYWGPYKNYKSIKTISKYSHQRTKAIKSSYSKSFKAKLCDLWPSLKRQPHKNKDIVNFNFHNI